MSRCALHGDRLAGALQHDHALHARAAAAEGLVGGALELDRLAAAPAAVGSDDELRLRVLDAIAQRGSREAAEHHRVDRADAVAGVHGDHDLGHQRHVDDDAIAAAHALRLQRIGEAAHFRVQLAIADAPHIAGLALEDDRGLVGARCQMHVEAVVGDIQPAVAEPAIVRCLAVIQPHGERLVPGELLRCQLAPEADVILARPSVQLLKIRRLDARARGERGGRSKGTLFDERGSYVLVSHDTLLAGAMRSIAESSRGGLQPRTAASTRSMLARACRT